MKLVKRFAVLLFVTVLTACSSVGPGSVSRDEGRVTVAFGERVLKHHERTEILKELNVVETLHEYILRSLERTRNSGNLRINVVITSMLIRMSRFNKNVSRMDCDIVIYEGDKEIMKFTSAVHTSKREEKAVRKLSAAVAREVASRLRDR